MSRRDKRGSGKREEPRAVRDFLERERFFSLEAAEQRTLLERLINVALGGEIPDRDSLGLYREMVLEIEAFSTRKVKAVVFGGGTGLSTILGGDSVRPGWAQAPFSGLKMLFDDLVVVVCSTDDGGSSGELVRRLPVIALGDIRRVILSGITPRGLKRAYRGLAAGEAAALPGLIRGIVNHRFGGGAPRARRARASILTLLGGRRRALLPRRLAEFLEGAWSRLRTHPALADLPLKRHCLGNLLILSEIYRDVPGEAGPGAVPGHGAIVRGIDRFARMAGAGSKTVFPASTRQGELRFLYTNGVVVSGEHKSSVSRRGFPVERVWAEYPGGPRIDPRVLDAVAAADVIITAPGSIYSSLIPILQAEEIVEAVRRNGRALKILGANFWVQKGETDITVRDLKQEFFVSDLIEAYNKNVPGGTAGLFDVVLTTNMKNFPAQVIQNYALEGKVPIYHDPERVARLGFVPVAAEVHSPERLERGRIFQHDPDKFARAVRILLSLKAILGRRGGGLLRGAAPGGAGRGRKRSAEKLPRWAVKRGASLPSAARTAPRRLFLSQYMAEVEKVLGGIAISSAKIRRVLPEIVWNNRDILLDHLGIIRGVRVVSPKKWMRSTEWDRILAYFDPRDYFLNVRADLLEMEPSRLAGDLLIGLGESLLGNYASGKSLSSIREGGVAVGKVFEITLCSAGELRSFLDMEKIRAYLELARMVPRPERDDRYGMVINDNDSFTPPGLLFGLLYAWYLDNGYGCFLDYEMSLLKIDTSDLIPGPVMEKERLKKLVAFFRREIFLNEPPALPGAGRSLSSPW